MRRELWAALVATTLAGPAWGEVQPVEQLAEGTRWETGLYRVDGAERAGPRVLVLGGVHGDEPAGAAAARGLLDWSLARGMLYVVPEANRPALRRATRFAPKTRFRDLNRSFPVRAGDAPRGTMATALWGLFERIEPQCVVDLHEGFDVHRINPKSVGSSVMFNPLNPAAGNAAQTAAQAQRLLDAVNATIESEQRRFQLLSRTAEGSLARAVTERLGIPAFILETTKNGQPIEVRVAQHHVLVARLLEDLGMGPVLPSGGSS